jgi:hypothetical protein
MKNAKSILIGTGSFVLAGLILTMFVPTAAHAIAATMVEITNTAANPVFSQVLNTTAFQSPATQASQIILLFCQVNTPCTRIDGTASEVGGYAGQFSVPEGQALVVTSVDVLPGTIPTQGPGQYPAYSYQDCLTNTVQAPNLFCYEVFATGPISLIGATNTQAGSQTTTHPLTSGIVISAGEIPELEDLLATPSGTLFYIHGYLSPVPSPPGNL